MSAELEYALYMGDTYLGQGTLQELADATKFKYSYLNFVRYPVYRRRCENKHIRYEKQLFLVKLGEKLKYE